MTGIKIEFSTSFLDLVRAITTFVAITNFSTALRIGLRLLNYLLKFFSTLFIDFTSHFCSPYGLRFSSN